MPADDVRWESSYGCCERDIYFGKATHAAHNAATVATKANKAIRPTPLTAASTALMAKIPAVTSQKPAGAATRWSTTPESVQAPVYSPLGSRRDGVAPPYPDLGRSRRGGASFDETPLRAPQLPRVTGHTARAEVVRFPAPVSSGRQARPRPL